MEGVAATGADAPRVALGGARALGSVTGLAGAHSFSVHARLIARLPEKANRLVEYDPATAQCTIARTHYRYFDMGRVQMTISEMRAGIQKLIDLMAPWIEKISVIGWREADGAFPLIVRAILRRQHEFLSAVVDITGGNRGYVAVTLLRPACEELIWLKYLKKLGVAKANELLQAKCAVEIGDILKAQSDYVGPAIMEQLGFPPRYVEEGLNGRETAKKKLRLLANELNWPPRHRDALPSVFTLARFTDTVPEYNFLYYGTSRFVHFSVIELLRRAWGKPGSISISSEHFLEYWQRFSLYWGKQLYLDTLGVGVDCVGGEGPEIDDRIGLEIIETLRELKAMPILTREEMEWSGELGGN